MEILKIDTSGAMQELEKLKKALTENYTAALTVITDTMNNLNSISSIHNSVQNSVAKNFTKTAKSEPTRITFAYRVAELLKQKNEPMSGKEIRAELNNSGEKEIGEESFSAQIISNYKKNKKSLYTQYVSPHLPMRDRYLYILKDWIDSQGKLKDEYLSKIEERNPENIGQESVFDK